MEKIAIEGTPICLGILWICGHCSTPKIGLQTKINFFHVWCCLSSLLHSISYAEPSFLTDQQTFLSDETDISWIGMRSVSVLCRYKYKYKYGKWVLVWMFGLVVVRIISLVLVWNFSIVIGVIQYPGIVIIISQIYVSVLVNHLVSLRSVRILWYS